MPSVNQGPARSASINQAPSLGATWSDSTGSSLVKPDGTVVGVSATNLRTRPISVSGVGDSITAKNNGNLDLVSLTTAQSYAVALKAFSAQSHLAFGAMRSGNTWFPFEYQAGLSGGTSQQVLSICVPALLGYPNGFPDMATVLVGTNDPGAGISTTQSIQNIKAIIQQLINAGIIPILCTPLPSTNSSNNALSASAAGIYALIPGILRLAREFNLPVADLHGALVNVSNGFWANSNCTQDGVHQSMLGATVMGYVINQAIQTFLGLPGRLMPRWWDGLTATQQGNISANPGFTQSINGTINTSSSYPSTTFWSAPGTPSMSTLFNSVGTEPGTASTHTMAVTPAIAGNSANFLGNAWAIAGNNTNSFSSSGPFCNVNQGDRLAMSARIKWIPSLVAASPGEFLIGVVDLDFGGVVAGLNYQLAGVSGATSAMQTQIGNEANYQAGDFYTEWTVNKVNQTHAQLRYQLTNAAESGSSNTNDTIIVANMQLINLTALGIVAP